MSTSSNIHINIGSLQNLLNSPPQGSEERKNALIASIFGDLSHRPNLTEFNTEEQNFLRNLYSNVIEQKSDRRFKFEVQQGDQLSTLLKF
jgi:hypothetical protein